jgi:chromosome segregation ATPase
MCAPLHGTRYLNERNNERARNVQLQQISQNTKKKMNALREEMTRKEQEIAQRNREIEEWRLKVSNREAQITRMTGEAVERETELTRSVRDVNTLRRQVTQRDDALLRDVERSQVYLSQSLKLRPSPFRVSVQVAS